MTKLPVKAARPTKTLVRISEVSRALAKADDPGKVIDLEKKLNLAEQYMKDAGTFRLEEIQEVNEYRMRARWKLGRLLVEVERGVGPGRGKKVSVPLTSFRAFIKQVGLTPQAAMEAQRIGALPEKELETEFKETRRDQVLNTFASLLRRARPFWHKERRVEKHQTIARKAKDTNGGFKLGPFPLLYVDPPWTFDAWSEMGKERSPERHYPVLTDAEIADFKVHGLTMDEVCSKDAALFLWCTSSNIHRALKIVDAWGFEFKTSGVWVKDKMGTGHIFRNRHELLLYATRGRMPAPQMVPASVWEFPRGKHSAKPPAIRTMIEKMYPDFDESTRLELFSRDATDGWTHYGFEADKAAA